MAGRAEKVFQMPVADVYALYERKIERKGGDVANLDTVITWLAGFDERTIKKHITARTSFREFFKAARLYPKAKLITGSMQREDPGD
jgi:hypothetical protein